MPLMRTKSLARAGIHHIGSPRVGGPNWANNTRYGLAANGLVRETSIWRWNIAPKLVAA